MITHYYEVEYLVPGERLNPPRVFGEWWKATSSHSTGMSFGQYNYSDALELRQWYRDTYGYKTRLAEVKISRSITEEDDW